MSDYRIQEHPILAIPGGAVVPFTWKGEALKARPGETIASPFHLAAYDRQQGLDDANPLR